MAEPKSAGLWANSISRGAGHYILYKTPVYEHAGCSGVQECRCGDRCKGGEGGELNLDIEGAGGVLQQDIDCRWGNCCKGSGEVTCMRSLNFSGCGFSLLWDMGDLVRLQQYVQSDVSVVGNWGAHFTSCSSKNPHLQGFPHPLTQAEAL